MKHIKYKDLVDFHHALFERVGLDEYSNNAVTNGLCETSLRGVDSHGVRLLPHYVNSAVNGRKNPNPNFSFQKNLPAIGHLDADNAFGHAAGMKAIEHAIEMADQLGMGAVAVSNSSHPGAVASMALTAARQGYIAFAFTHADALVLSHGGTRSYFGTNPICFAVPREEEEPYCLDMASSIVPWNRVLMHRNSQEPLQDGVAADENGMMTTDPDKAASLYPTGSYKGYGIASMVEVLCGVYTGMSFGRSIPSMYKAAITEPRHLGQFYMVMRVDGVLDKAEFLTQMQQMTDEVRSEPNAPGESVMLPGDKEVHEAKKRMIEGVPLDPVTANAFSELAAKYDIPLTFIPE